MKRMIDVIMFMLYNMNNFNLYVYIKNWYDLRISEYYNGVNSLLLISFICE